MARGSRTVEDVCVLFYQRQDASLTLREGLAEYRAANPDLDQARDPGGEAAEFFRCHDVAHVVFACSTNLLNEAMADAWSLFGTTLTLQEFLGFLRLEEHQRIVKRVGFWGLVTTIVRAAPITARIALRGYRMSVAWPWASFDSQLERLLTDIRREFNIKVLYVP